MQKKSEDLFDEATRIAGAYRSGERAPAPGRKTPAALHAPAPPVAPPVAAKRLLPADSAARKQHPMCTGLLDYFPDALAEVARISWLGNQKHNPGEALHWARGKSMDHADCVVRHLTERGGFDPAGIRHSAQLAWRALALLQQELEDELNLPLPRGAKNEIA